MSRYFIIDAVAHAYNQSPENRKKRLTSINGAYAYHKMTNPLEFTLTEKQWARNWLPEDFIDTMLLESETDVVCMHSVPLFEYSYDGLVSNEKGAYLKAHYPDRVVWYGALDLGEPRARVVTLADQLVKQGADGIKLYPSGLNHQTGQASEWFMSDRDIAFPIFDHLRGLGIRHIAIHKLLEYDALTGRQQRAYGINDIGIAAKAYPDLTFHLVHAGWLLMEDTILLLQDHDNVTAVLEGPMLWPLIDPKRFDLFMSRFMNSVGSERMMYSSAATNPHPRWVIEAFENYLPPSDADFRLTEADRQGIFGRNFARIHGIDLSKRQAAIKDDRFSRYKASNGLRRPWTAVV